MLRSKRKRIEIWLWEFGKGGHFDQIVLYCNGKTYWNEDYSPSGNYSHKNLNVVNKITGSRFTRVGYL
jgi:hypothetical protein